MKNNHLRLNFLNQKPPNFLSIEDSGALIYLIKFYTFLDVDSEPSNGIEFMPIGGLIPGRFGGGSPPVVALVAYEKQVVIRRIIAIATTSFFIKTHHLSLTDFAVLKSFYCNYVLSCETFYQGLHNKHS